MAQQNQQAEPLSAEPHVTVSEQEDQSTLSLAELLSAGARIEAQSDERGLEVLVNNEVITSIREIHVVATTREGVHPEVKLRCLTFHDGVEEWQDYIIFGTKIWITAQRHNPDPPDNLL